jgi:Xaa-Pro aminopeptidase
VVVTKEKAVFFTDFRYREKAAKEVKTCEVQLFTSLKGDVLPFLQDQGVTRLYVQIDKVSLTTFSRWEQVFEGIHLSRESQLTDLLENLRSVKNGEEIRRIKAAQAMTDETFSYILERIEVGRSEIDIMLDMEFYMRRLGSEGVSFDFIVVSGQNSSLPHGVPTHKKIQKGDFVTMDFGAVVNGYRSDMTRTVAVGEVSSEQRNVYETVLCAKRAAMEGIKPQIKCQTIDKIARDLIDKAGYQGCFGHGLGHSVGLDIHENPCFNTRCETLLQSGMVLTVEPGIYLENKFGVRIEDMIVVTEQGYENLTQSSDELIIV